MSLDPLFGPVIMLVIGGIQVELIKDITFSLHPLRDIDPERMLKELKELALLTGWRGRPPSDVKALKDILLRFSALVEDFPEIDKVETNPLFVLKENEGCVAADARIFLNTGVRS